MNQEQWRKKSYDEWVGRTTGSRLNADQARGADARRAADAAARARWESLKPPKFRPPEPSVRPVPPAAQHTPVVGPVAGSWNASSVRPSGSAKASRVLGLLGAFIGYVYGVGADAQFPWVYAVAGGLIGVLALDILRFVFKLVKIVVLTIIALVGIAITLYVLSRLFGS